MPTWILTWDGSDAGYTQSEYEADVASTRLGHLAPCRWSMGTRRGGTAKADRVFLLRQGGERGVVASGTLADGAVFEEGHWDDPAKTARYADVLWDRVLDVEDRLSIEQLLTMVPEHHWNSIYASGQELHEPSAGLLETLWADHLAGIATVPTGWTLPVGSTLGRRARMEQFGGAMYGGIQPSNGSPNVFIYSDPHAGVVNGYNYDGWSAAGDVYLYTGEGRTGPQKMRAGNAALLNHKANGRALRLFVADGSEPDSDAKIQRYVGEFQLLDQEPLVAEAPDADGNPRTVFVFRLAPVGAVLRREEDQSSSGDSPGAAEAVPVAVEAAATPPGSAEAVPLEALGSVSYSVAGSTATMAVKTEAELVARYQAHLQAKGSVCVRYRLRPPGELRDLYTDLLDQTENVLYEAKGVATREAVRMAIGQLLDYSRHIPTQPAHGVLLPSKPASDLLDLLARHGIRCVHETTPGTFLTA